MCKNYLNLYIFVNINNLFIKFYISNKRLFISFTNFLVYGKMYPTHPKVRKTLI